METTSSVKPLKTYLRQEFWHDTIQSDTIEVPFSNELKETGRPHRAPVGFDHYVKFLRSPYFPDITQLTPNPHAIFAAKY